MYSETTTVTNATGLHARPASLFSKTAGKYACNVTIKKAGTDDAANAKSMLNLMAKGFSCGTEVEIAADGEGEQEAVKELVKLLEDGCGE